MSRVHQRSSATLLLNLLVVACSGVTTEPEPPSDLAADSPDASNTDSNSPGSTMGGATEPSDGGLAELAAARDGASQSDDEPMLGADAGFMPDPNGQPGGSAVVISGRIMPPVASTLHLLSISVGARRVSHIMALNPETSAPERTLAEVADDGSFELEVEPGRPYVLVFIDDEAVGVDMVVAIFRAGTLDTVAPLETGTLELEDITIDDMEGVASSSSAYDDLLGKMGLSAAGAEYLGSVDDLSLRYANPDIDGNGVIDVSEDHLFSLDFHIRANMTLGQGGENVRFSDMTDQFLPEAGDTIATPVFGLSSVYALYGSALDTTDYVADPGTLQAGAAFVATHADDSAVSLPASFSGLGFGDISGWGPDYNLVPDGDIELPGSTGSPATLIFTLGTSDVNLTFSNVITRTKASLTAEGVLLPFLKFNTELGVIASVDYKWMQRAAEGWQTASAEAVELTVSEGGGYASISRGSKDNRIGIRIPTTASGNIPWARASMTEVSASISDEEFTATGLDDLCGMALSYDDKLGLRIFAGGAEANEGLVTCP